MWIKYNPNPVGNYVEDCVQRAMSAALGVDWDTASDIVHEFAQTINGRDQSEVWPVMDELMFTIKIINERLYNGVMRKLQ